MEEKQRRTVKEREARQSTEEDSRETEGRGKEKR